MTIVLTLHIIVAIGSIVAATFEKSASTKLAGALVAPIAISTFISGGALLFTGASLSRTCISMIFYTGILLVLRRRTLVTDEF